jgi:ribosomal-protein-alanine N-acetyltransferase
MTLTTLFETERLLVRPWTVDDAEAAFAIYGDPEVWRYMGGGDGHADVAQSRAALERIVARYAERPGLGLWAIVEKATGEIVGSVELVPLDGGPEIEVGYHLARRAWGRGIASEATRGAVRHAFETLELPRVVGVVYPDNLASRRVLEKAGLTYEKHGRWYGWDLDYFSLDAGRWRRTDGEKGKRADGETERRANGQTERRRDGESDRRTDGQ